MSRNTFKNGKPTIRGFCYKEFTDRYGAKCSLQESSLVDPSIWLGVNKEQSEEFKKNFSNPESYTRMHLSYNQVKELVKDLQRWLARNE